MTEVMERGQQWLEQILHLAQIPSGVKVDQFDATGEESVNYWLTIDESQLTEYQIEILTGEDGIVLDSIQYLANSILNLNQSPEEQASYTIELNGYRLKRQEELRAMAESVAKIVRETGQEVEMKYLSSAERREVHEFLQGYFDLETYSRGQEPDRRLVVKLR